LNSQNGWFEELVAMPRSGTTRRPSGQPQRARSERSGVSPRKPTAIDKHVGKRLRLLRQINEVSLEKLAEIVDVAPQQIQKYEIGETRISASRIFELSKIFGVPLTWFYDDLKPAASTEMYARIGRYQDGANATASTSTEASQEALLITYFKRSTPDIRQKLIDLARILSELSVRHAE
jgi:transcriptional regulator with XRE-family HTH domain